MKQAIHTQHHGGFMPLILVCTLLSAQVARAQEQQQQQHINVDVSTNYNNTHIRGNQSRNNINTVISTGPNGVGLPNINVQVIDNGTGLNFGGPNMRGFTPTVIPKQTVNSQAANKPKTTRPATVKTTRPKPVVSSTAPVQRPKPKPQASTAVSRRVVRPAAPPVVTPVAVAPALAVPEQVQAPVSNPVVPVNNLPQAIQQVMNDVVIVQTRNVPAVSAPVAGIASAPAVRSGMASAGSGSSGKSHRSGRKKHGSFYYATNKRMSKLFAKTKNRRFDPAKCFVWK